ncbi:MAG: primosomal protein N', partial [Christensenellaceae bacterium]|nr:primosomal protein N' [Christensenellaceae bacterium]
EWRRVKTGQAKVVVGARSAIFLPMEDLGLIILDEQHEQSYRADNHPPYHAAEIAAMRSRLCGATVVLASATPLVEDYMRAEHGIYELVRMPSRIGDLPLPAIRVVDMKGEFVKGNRSQISGPLHAALAETLEKGEQALLFLNRRGYAAGVICPSCGQVRMCTHCDVPLKYHKDKEALLCHYCGRSVPFTKRCPNCGEPFARLTGTGTQQLEEQIHKFFPRAKTLRMDFDTTRAKDAHQRIYDAFKKGEADILIGTQMIARGLDFDKVSLAAVISADSLLSAGDYRAEERTFSMIEQVAGRAGRKKPGKVIVQTYNPEHFAITAAANHDYEGFYRQEIAFRQVSCKPPFSRFFRLVFTHADEKKAENACRQAEIALKEMLKPHKSAIILFVAKEAPVARLDGKSRYHLLIKAKKTGQTAQIKKLVAQAAEQVSRSCRGVTVGFEVDPFDMN